MHRSDSQDSAVRFSLVSFADLTDPAEKKRYLERRTTLGRFINLMIYFIKAFNRQSLLFSHLSRLKVPPSKVSYFAK